MAPYNIHKKYTHDKKIDISKSKHFSRFKKRQDQKKRNVQWTSNIPRATNNKSVIITSRKRLKPPDLTSQTSHIKRHPSLNQQIKEHLINLLSRKPTHLKKRKNKILQFLENQHKKRLRHPNNWCLWACKFPKKYYFYVNLSLELK